MSEFPGIITVLAGVNGAGKSSVAGASVRSGGGEYFNPDEAARRYRETVPGTTQEQANAWAWETGRKRLEEAISRELAFTFETTLGGNTIPGMLLDAARAGIPVWIFYVGLSSAELHLARVRQRVAYGGHDIPEAKIRERWENSLRNLIFLVPHLNALSVFDNSAEGDPASGKSPAPLHILSMRGGKITQMISPPEAPLWTKPLLVAAMRQDPEWTGT